MIFAESKTKKATAKSPTAYDRKKKKEAAKQAAMVHRGQLVPKPAPPVNPEARAKGEKSFKFFCEYYFPEIFYMEWSPDHDIAIIKIEDATGNGGLFALAMPRGQGKTCLMQIACLWAALYGKVLFITLIAASADRAKDLLENIKTWLETNAKLHEDFPEITGPIRALERITNRQKGQKDYNGKPTYIEWNADKIVLPTMPDSQGAGVVITCSGLKGSDIRGQNHARPDGRVVRPELAMLDDPQTTESAWSESQSRRREAILAGDVLGMAGPGKKIAGLMACTVIRPGDMADRILDRKIHPEWRGQRTKMVYEFPTDTKLWEQYRQIRADSLENDGDGHEATQFYKENRAAMDEGSKVSWPARYNTDELSAIQHAMNLMFRDKAAFFAEYQNEPLVDSEGEEMLTAEEIRKKLNGYKRDIIPSECNYLTAYIDVHKHLLYYAVIAWENTFTGYIIDNGVWPDQKRPVYKMADIKKRQGMMGQMPGLGLEGAIYNGLTKLTSAILGKAYNCEDGLDMYISRCLIDANWGESTDVVYQFCKESTHARTLYPAHGMFVGASSMPFSEYRRKKGDRVGHHWRIPTNKGKRQTRYVLIDANYWKSFIHARLAVARGDAGCLSLFGSEEQTHEIIASHLTAEYRVKTEGRGREVDEWKLKITRPDNHLLDCIAGAAVAASIEGVKLFGVESSQKRKKKLVLSEIQKKRRK